MDDVERAKVLGVVAVCTIAALILLPKEPPQTTFDKIFVLFLCLVVGAAIWVLSQV